MFSIFEIFIDGEMNKYEINFRRSDEEFYVRIYGERLNPLLCSHARTHTHAALVIVTGGERRGLVAGESERHLMANTHIHVNRVSA